MKTRIWSEKRSEEREDEVKPRRLCFPSGITIQAPAIYFWK